MPWRKTPLRRFHRLPTTVLVLLFGLALKPGVSRAGDADANSDPLREITVIGTTPIPGTAIDVAKIPNNVQTLVASDLTQDGTASLAGALNNRLASISITDTLADPFQPDIVFRGFQASPVLGVPQGLAVYQNGARVNEAFGDAVNWDLIPDVAISRIDLVSSNPSYGLNALGGAIAVTMKNAFNFHDTEAELSGGSFNQRAGSVQVGFNDGRFGVYAAGRVLNQDGWRLFARDSVRQFYLDLGARAGAATIDLSYLRADTRLFGQGAAPVQELKVSPKLVFTGPQGSTNRLDFLTINASYGASDTFSWQSVLYARNFDQSLVNGNTTRFTTCTAALDAGLLCQADGLTPLVNAAGENLADISQGGTVIIGENDFESIQAKGLGGSLQISDSQPAWNRGNQFTAGVAFDSAQVDFSSGTQVGVIDSALTVLPSNLLVDTPENSQFPATPVMLKAANKYYGIYVTDTFDMSGALAVTASGRYNIAQLNLSDHRGTALSGKSRYSHFNPAIGATYRLLPQTTTYANYAVTNRTPTASEIECSDPLKPCLLPANLAGDPPNLKQVVAHTYEIGLRGKNSGAGDRPSRFDWNLSLFRTELDDDIYAIATSISSGFFQNIGATRRQGLEAGLNYHGLKWSCYAEYSFVDATFQSPFTENSSSNPHQDADGNVRVQSGDHLPGIPQHRIKAGADYNVRGNWSVGGELVFVGGQFYRGDESNQNPRLPAYHVVTLHTSYRVSGRFEVFGTIRNMLNASFATLGLFSDPTGVGAPGIPRGAESNAPGVDNRFQSPAAPRAYFGGIRVTF
jgi:iron complex outermembrane receptor protein